MNHPTGNNLNRFELSERVDRARRDFLFSVLIFLLFVSFDIEGESNVFGFDVKNVDDSRMEFFSFVISIILFFNYALRIIDEITEFSAFNFKSFFADAESAEKQNRDAIDNLASAFDSTSAAIKNLKKLDFHNLAQSIASDLRTYHESKQLIENRNLIESLLKKGNLDDLTLASHRRHVRDAISLARIRLEPADKFVESFKKSISLAYTCVEKAEKIIIL